MTSDTQFANPTAQVVRNTALLNKIAHVVSRGECNLFLGTGPHADRPGTLSASSSSRPANAAELSVHLARCSRLLVRRHDEDIQDLARVSADFELLFGRNRLVQEVRSQVQTGKRPSRLLRILARLDFPLVLTTNYDTLLEDTLVAAGKSPFVTVYKNNIAVSERTEDYPVQQDPTPDAPLVVKLHGDILRHSSSIVITDEDRIQFSLRLGDRGAYHPIPGTALYLLAKRPTLFLGYSFRDHNIRLLLKSLRWSLDAGNVPAMYVVDRAPDTVIAGTLQTAHPGVNYLVQDLWRIVPALARAVQRAKHRTV